MLRKKDKVHREDVFGKITFEMLGRCTALAGLESHPKRSISLSIYTWTLNMR